MVMRTKSAESMGGVANLAEGAAEYVLPSPPRGPRAPYATVAESAFEPGRAGLHLAGDLGARVQLQTESLEHLLEDLREQVLQLSAAAEHSAYGSLRGPIRGISELVERCGAVQRDLAAESAQLSSEGAAVDLAEVCARVACSRGPRAAIEVGGHAAATCWADRAAVCRLLEVALDLVQARTGERGANRLEVIGGVDGPGVRVLSDAAARGDVDAELVDAFRAAAARAGARVHRDALEQGGAAFVLSWRK